MALCKEGEVSCLRKNYNYRCTPRLLNNRSLTDDLAKESDQMEKCHQQWKETLHTKRRQYSELNHFTNLQLLFLRKKLAFVKERDPEAVDSIPLKVYNLLKSVLPGTEQATMKSALVSCGSCIRKTDNPTRSYGISSTLQHSVQLHRSGLLENPRLSLVEMFQTLVLQLESSGYTGAEQIAIAAMFSCKESSDWETDVNLWCVKNASNKDLVNARYLEALKEKKYLALTSTEKKR